MANEARRTLTQMMASVRSALDEQTASFWSSDPDLYTVFTRAAHAVATEVRRIREDYFVRSLASTDASYVFGGETYAPSSLAIVAGTAEYTLPPDLLELKLIEGITTNYTGTVFEYRDITDPAHRASRAATTNQSPNGGFYFDILGERTLTIAPKSDTAFDVRITYISSAIIRSSADVYQMDFLATTDQLVMPFPGYMAVEEVATMRAMLKDSNVMAAAWAKMAENSVQRLFSAGARQSQDTTVVQSMFE